MQDIKSVGGLYRIITDLRWAGGGGVLLYTTSLGTLTTRFDRPG